MPVVGGRDPDRVDRAIVEDRAEVADRLRGLARAFLDDRRCLGQSIAIDVADVGDLHVAPAGEQPEVVAPHPPRADQADRDTLSRRSPRLHATEGHGGRAQRAPFEYRPTPDRSHGRAPLNR